MKNRSANVAFGLAGCLLPVAVVAVGFIPSYLMAGYTLDYWGSQYRGCPTSFGPIPKLGLTIVTPGIIVPGALVTLIADQVKPDDVMPGPRAEKLGLPLCD
jgi:hypothetical protein